MICKNCGKEVLEDSKFCTYCGTQFEEYPDVVLKEEKEKETELKDDFTITSYHIKGRTILKVLTLMLIVFFWCPMFTVSCGNINAVNISLDDVAEGIGSLKPVYGMWLFLALPILSFASLFSKNGKENDGPFSAAAGGTSAIMFVVTYISAQQKLKGTEYNVVLHKLSIYYLYILCSVAIFVVGFIIACLQQKIENMAEKIIMTEQQVKKKAIKLILEIMFGLSFMFLILYDILNGI